MAKGSGAKRSKLLQRVRWRSVSTLGGLTVFTAIALLSGIGGWVAYVHYDEQEHKRTMQQRLERLAHAIAEDGVCVRLQAKRSLSGDTPFALLVPSETEPGGVDTVTEFLGQTVNGDTLLRFTQLPLEYPAVAEISLLLRYVSPDVAAMPLAAVEHGAVSSGAIRHSPYERFLDTVRIGKYVDEKLVFPPYHSIDLAIVDTTANVVLFRRGAIELSNVGMAQHAITIFNNRLSGMPIRIFAGHPHSMRTVAFSNAPKLIIFLLALGAVFMIAWKSIRLGESRTKLAHMQMDLVSNMTHELNTPVANMSLALDTLRRSRSSAMGLCDEQLWEIVRAENDRLRSSINKVLDVSLLEGRQLALQPELHDINAILDRTTQGFSLAAEEQHIRIELNPEAKEPWVMLDVTYMGNVFHALIDNAIKYSGGNARITIRSSNVDGGVLVLVSDNGPGIPKTDRELVFEKFYRVRTVDRYAVKGTGIGLYYVRQVIQAHGGWVRLGEQDQGTLIELFLPTEYKNNGQATDRRG